MKFNEDQILEEIKKYTEDTYKQHYSGMEEDAPQTLELMGKIPLRMLHFCTMSALKYVDRYGLKEGYNRKDLLKAIHFLVISLYVHDKIEEKKDKE